MRLIRDFPRRIWRRAPGLVRAPVEAVIIDRLVSDMRRSGAARPAPGPLVVSGLVNESLGLGRAGRLTAAALRHAGFDLVEHDVRPLFDLHSSTPGAFPVPQPGGVWVLHLNAPEAVHVLRVLRPEWQERYRIGYWAWELERVPPLWVRVSNLFHEIWAPSNFVAEALVSSGVQVPVRVMPHPAPMLPELREVKGAPPDAFTVLAAGDVRSSPERKNLLGAVDIYRGAFPQPSAGRRMIVKILKTPASNPFARELEARVNDRPDIIVREDDVAAGEMARLIASCSVVLSPHRAEGFGLMLAEGLCLGVPVLATGWSGNMTFMQDLPEMQISYKLVRGTDPYRVYRTPGFRWAEPDAREAITKLRRLEADPALRAQLGVRGREAALRLVEPWSRANLDAQSWPALIRT